MDMIQTSPPASEEMIKSAALHAAQALGYTQLKQKQAEVVEHFLSGQDVLAVLPTGYVAMVVYLEHLTTYQELQMPLQVL